MRLRRTALAGLTALIWVSPVTGCCCAETGPTPAPSQSSVPPYRRMLPQDLPQDGCSEGTGGTGGQVPGLPPGWPEH